MSPHQARRPLRRLRQRHQLSLREASERAGLSGSFLSAVERGGSGASIANLQRLAAAYGTTLPGPFGASNATGPRTARTRARSLPRPGNHLRAVLQILLGAKLEDGVDAHALEASDFCLQAGSVVDLRDAKVQAALGTNVGELAINFRSMTSGPAPTQMLGERCAASTRIDGLLFDSPAMPGKANLAVLEAALSLLGSSLAVNDPANNLFDSLP